MIGSSTHCRFAPASSIIHQAALSHAFYTLFNGADQQLRDLGIHNEVKGGLGYSGDNQLAQNADYDQYSITAPLDARLPGGGGYTIPGLYDVTPNLFGRVSSLTAPANKILCFGGDYCTVENVAGHASIAWPHSARFCSVSAGRRDSARTTSGSAACGQKLLGAV